MLQWVHLYFQGTFLQYAIFVVQKVVAPKKGVKFCQKFIIAIRYSLVTLCIMRCCLTFWDKQNIWNKLNTQKMPHVGDAQHHKALAGLYHLCLA